MAVASAADLIEALGAQRTVGLGLLDADLRFVAMTPGLKEMDATHPVLERALAGQPLHDIDFVAGDRRFVVSYVPVEAPPAVMAVIVVEETRARRAAQVEIRIAQRRLELALEGTETGTFEWDAGTNELHWSDNLGPLWGHPRGWQPDDYEGYLATLHPDDVEEMTAVVGRALEQGVGYTFEFRCVWPDGSAHWRETRVHAVAEPGGPPVLVGLVIDIDERRRRETAARYLADASLALSQAAGVEAMLQEVAELAVPALAQGCVVHLDAEDGAARQVAAAGDTAADGMVAQIVTRGRMVGAITFRSNRTYGAAELELAEELGRRVGVAIDNARLQEAERRAHRRLAQLHAITDAALTHLELDDLLTELLRRLPGVMGATAARVLLVDPDRGDLVTRASAGEDPVGLPVTALPLRAAAGVVGQLQVATDAPGGFDADELDLLARAADRIGLAIDHARLYERMRDTAVTLQRSLLPAALPPIQGLSAAVRYLAGQEGTEVGGDWYDLFTIQDGRVALVVGDVAGRGIDAAAGMGQLRGGLRAYAGAPIDPAEALEQLDGFMLGLGGVDFATVALAQLDPATGEVALSLAGHPPPVIRRADGSAGVHEVPAGPPIGVAGPRRRPTVALRLEPGEVMLLYTDGLIERRGTLIDERIARLAAAVAAAPGDDPEALADHVLSVMLEGATGRDDVALVALRRDS